MCRWSSLLGLGASGRASVACLAVSVLDNHGAELTPRSRGRCGAGGAREGWVRVGEGAAELGALQGFHPASTDRFEPRYLVRSKNSSEEPLFFQYKQRLPTLVSFICFIYYRAAIFIMYMNNVTELFF